MTRAHSFQPHRLWTLAAILLALLVAKALVENIHDRTAIDFVAYWAAAKLALAGHAAHAYDLARHAAIERQVVALGGDVMPFAYPPPFLLLVFPLAPLPFFGAALVWVAATLAAYLVAVRRLLPGMEIAAVAFPPVMACAILGQNGLLTAALMIAGIALIDRRPWLAGALLGCLMIKPHLGVLIPLCLIARRDWRAFAGAAAGSIALALLGLAAFGLPAWRAFVAMMPLFGSLAADGGTGWHKLASVYAALRLAGVPATLASGLHALIAMAGAALVWRRWRESADPIARGAALVVGTALLSPYLYVYDQVMLIVAIGHLWRRGLPQGAIAALYAIPLAAILLTTLPHPRINPAPLLPIALLALLWRERHTTGAPLPSV